MANSDTKTKVKRIVKYCVVPWCRNNSVSKSKLLFVRVPDNPVIRNKWYDIIKPTRRTMSNNRIFVCENHFDLRNDTENYMQFKLMGYKLIMKKGIVPHRNLTRKVAKQSECVSSDKVTPAEESNQLLPFPKLQTEEMRVCSSPSVKFHISGIFQIDITKFAYLVSTQVEKVD